ncbi:MAG: PD40 domain-containing protein [Candidatus Dormibacteraeota bacterium]|nr:PD40 domain-containing protein [Candidatus Dormibacteraeota bacterium]MBV9526713.1 PD40 domain-containing protein [Candidatus Dormibacteraeota bacterium]
MRRALTIVVLLALMGAFAFGVNRFFALRKAHVAEASTPTVSKPAFVLPGTIYVAQQGVMYKLNRGTFTALRLPKNGTWMQPAIVPGTNDIVAVMRTAAYSEVFQIDGVAGTVINQLSHNATTSSTIQLNHWMFWPRLSADGQTLYVSYDSPKSIQSYEIEFAVWAGPLSGKIASKQWTDPFSYTGGDVAPVPLPGGALLYSKYEISGGNVYSRLAIDTRARADPVYLTNDTDDCGQPAVSPDGTQLAMVCTGGTGLQSTRLEVAPLTGTTLGTPRTLVDNCLCSSPQWSPDGRSLVYYAPADATGHFQLWWIDGAAGLTPKPPKQVTQNLDLDATSPPAWSPA